MDGKRFQKVENDRPIAKPGIPLPMDFSPSRRQELATQPQRNALSARNQHAHFYRKEGNGSGTPEYGFYITETKEHELSRSH